MPCCYAILPRAPEYSLGYPGQSAEYACAECPTSGVQPARTSNWALCDERGSAFTPNRGLATECSVRAVHLGLGNDLLAHLSTQGESGFDIERRVDECIER
jgi:hypothetical protein